MWARTTNGWLVELATGATLRSVDGEDGTFEVQRQPGNHRLVETQSRAVRDSVWAQLVTVLSPFEP